jgi:hypothetical protein
MLLCFSSMSSAVTYYVSSQSGDDTASGRTSNSEGVERPWKSLARASFQEYRNGDSLLLRCGERFEGRLDIRVADGEGLLRIAPYGDCPAGQPPVIDGTVALQGVESGGRLRAKLMFEPGKVVLDGKPLARSFARYRVIPDQTIAGSLKLQPQLPPDASISQALAMVRSRDWLVEPVRLASRGGSLGLGSPVTQYPIQAGVALAITGKEWVLGREGWIYDRESGEIVVAGAKGRVRVAEPKPLVRIRGAGSVLLDGLQLEFAGENALEIEIKGVSTLRGSVIISPGRHGVEIRSTENFSSLDTRFSGAGEHAIHVVAAGRVSVLRNLIEDTAVLEPLMPSVAALHVERARNALVTQTRIERSGYVGIRFGEGAEIRSNLIIDSCLGLSDCAAIYTWVNNPVANRRPSRVVGNLVVNVVGNDEVKLGAKVHASGIYLDDFTTQVNVEDNVIFGARQGIYLHNAFMHRLVRNVTVGDLEESFAVHVDSNNPGIATRTNLGNTVIDNLMMPSEKGAGLSVIRRIRVHPFAEFNAKQRDGNTRAVITWIENTSSFEQPVYRREPSPPGESEAIVRGLSHQQGGAIPAAKNWIVASEGKGFRVWTQARSFRLDTSATSGNCETVMTLKSGVLALSAESVSLLDCGR